jgi:hypothetical protein
MAEHYDKSIGSEERSAVSATKRWIIILAIVVLIGIALIATFLMNPTGGSRSGGVASENTAVRPAEP